MGFLGVLSGAFSADSAEVLYSYKSLFSGSYARQYLCTVICAVTGCVFG